MCLLKIVSFISLYTFIFSCFEQRPTFMVVGTNSDGFDENPNLGHQENKKVEQKSSQTAQQQQLESQQKIESTPMDAVTHR